MGSYGSLRCDGCDKNNIHIGDLYVLEITLDNRPGSCSGFKRVRQLCHACDPRRTP